VLGWGLYADLWSLVRRGQIDLAADHCGLGSIGCRCGRAGPHLLESFASRLGCLYWI